MTPLLNRLQEALVATQLVNREQLEVYFIEAQPAYSIPFNPNGQLPPDATIEMEITPPATLVIKPFAGDVLDLMLALNLILDDLAPAGRGNDKRFTVSAEVLDDRESVLIITLKLRERVRYIPSETGNLSINGVFYQRESVEALPTPPLLKEIRYVEP